MLFVRCSWYSLFALWISSERDTQKKTNQSHLDNTVSCSCWYFFGRNWSFFVWFSCAFSRWADCIQEKQAPFNIHQSHKHFNKQNEKKHPHSLHHWITHNVHVYFWGQKPKQKHKENILCTYHLSSNKEYFDDDPVKQIKGDITKKKTNPNSTLCFPFSRFQAKHFI